MNSSLSQSSISVDKKEYGQIGIITLNRPEVLNTWNSTLAAELDQALLELDKDEEVRVIVINGSGRGFSAGIQITTDIFESMTTSSEYYRWISSMEKPGTTISRMKKPVIASVHGFCMANGIGLVASCDLAIAEKGARFGATGINAGLNCIGPQVALYRNLGKKRTLELVLTGKQIDADEAERIGLINKVVPREKLEEETMNLAKNLASKSPLALQSAKRSFYDMSDLEYSKAMELVNNQFAMLCTTEDAREGVRAFNEKREPQWKLR